MVTARQVRFGPRSYRVRDVRAGDVAIVAEHRERVFVEHSPAHDGELAAMTAAFTGWLQRKLREGRYVGWLAETGGAVVAGIGVFLVEWPPHPAHYGPLRGYVMNAFTEPGHRGNGIGEYLMRLAARHAHPVADAGGGAPFAPLRHESLALAGAPEPGIEIGVRGVPGAPPPPSRKPTR